MELIRKILFLIGEKYVDVWLRSNQLQIEGYSFKEIAYHCSILQDAGLISEYKGLNADNGLYDFGVGRLTWDGHELLDKIKNDNVWSKTKETIKSKGIPFVLDAVKQIATAITSSLIKSALLGI